MNAAQEVILIAAVAAAAPKLLYQFHFNRRRKNYLKFKWRRMTIALGVYFGSAALLIHAGYKPLEGIVFGLAAGTAAGFVVVREPRRRRTIPAHVKRAVIERDLKGGTYDAKIHHIDHIVPFSLDGDHSPENLRVIPKVENLRRGARKPRLKELL